MLRATHALVFALAVLAVAPVRAEDLRERDLDVLVRRSAIVARAEVVDLSADGADLHLLSAYLQAGQKAEVVRVRSEGERAMHPALGDRGLYFLGPAQKPGSLAFVQMDFERWQIEPEADAAVDAFMARLVVASTSDTPLPMDPIWIDGLTVPVPSLSLHCAQQLAAVAGRGGLDGKAWDGIFAFLQDPAREDSKAAAVGALAKVLPADRTVALLPKLADGSKVKAALLLSAGALASGADGREQARVALGTAGRDGSPEVALAAAIGLASLGDDSAIPALQAALRSDDVENRHQAVEALAALAAKGSRAARARLHNLFEDSDGLVRARARNAWVAAYLADPVRQKRIQPSLVLVGAALVMILAVVGHSLLARRRT